MSSIVPLRSKILQLDNRDKDFYVDFSDDAHVRVMKLFPFCWLPSPPSNDSFRRFHLRFYFPREIFQDKKIKADKIFIMVNGLDETSYFSLYDQIGQGLAKNGFASVLLPLPNHLNRNPQYRFFDEKKYEKPSDTFLKEKGKIFLAFSQYMNEIKILTEHLTNHCDKSVYNCNCKFYSDLFVKNPKISLLGYSLGGLAVLSCFLNRPTNYNTCVLLNSGSKLGDIDVSHFIEIEKWKRMVKGLKRDWKQKRNSISFKTKHKIFEKVFLGNHEDDMREELEELSRRVLFILGGADTVTKYESIKVLEPKDHGLSVFKIPGLHHFLALDTEWNTWFDIITTMISRFEENSNRSILSYTEVLNELIEFNRKYKFINGIDDYDETKITDENDLMEFQRIKYAASSNYGNLQTAIAEMFLFMHRATQKPKMYPNNHFDGYNNLICQKAKIEAKHIEKAIKIQREQAQRSGKITKIADILIDNKIKSKNHFKKYL